MKTGYLRTALVSGGLTTAFIGAVGFMAYRHDQTSKATIKALETQNAALAASNTELRAGLDEAAGEMRARTQGMASMQETAKAIAEHAEATESYAQETGKRITELCACPKRR